MVSGCDLWLNTPKKPMEASGTSGMKATLNGVLNLSVLDGWWIEGCIDGVTGWSIDGDSEEAELKSLYHKLDAAAHTYRKDRRKWVEMMRSAVSLNGSFFNSHRAMQQYVTNAYWN
jgi:starch phosphorylase